ncbi:zinc finger protein 888-like [Anthonomus grandis grandis]|uniref:zinc finger protein 888-like n=1 Tax=Anthonomus grandis grandis TaxID=2921223 RepID=UPI002166B934|nr:zinc finger protein 888-like [Anthonomus grandis grandis]
MHMLRHTERMHKGMDLSAIKREMNAEDDGPNYETPEGVKDLSLKRSDNMSIYCSICGAVFKHVASLKYHLTNNVCTKPKKDEEQKQLKCPVCGKTFKGVTAMQYHVRRRVCEQVKPAVGPPWACSLCGTLFNLKQSWYVHMRREACKKYPQKYGLNNSKTLIPKIELTEGTDNLNEQINEDSEIIPTEDECAYLQLNGLFVCTKCGRSFAKVTNLYRHYNICNPDDLSLPPGLKKKNFQCPECSNSFTRLDNLQRHMRLICGKSSRPFKCSVCSKTFKLKHHLKNHVIGVHLKGGPNIILPDEGQLEVMENLEFGHEFPSFPLANYYLKEEDWYVCKQCNKRYKHRTSVWRHIKWECNKKPQFACHICGKRVTQKTSLKAHVENLSSFWWTTSMYAQGVTPDFDIKGHLLNMRRMNVEKPRSLYVMYATRVSGDQFICGFCGKIYKYKYTLKRHMENECSGEKPFACDLCGAKFTQYPSIKRHKIAMHNFIGFEQI